MKDTVIRYFIVAALGAFMCSICSCGTNTKHATQHRGGNLFHNNYAPCAAYQ